MEPSGLQAGDAFCGVESRGMWLEWQPIAQGTELEKNEAAGNSKIQLKSFRVGTFDSWSDLEEDKGNGEGKVLGV